MDKLEKELNSEDIKCLIVRRYHNDTEYSYGIITDCLEQLNVKCTRGDTGTFNVVIDDEPERKQENSINTMKDKIRSSTFVIADISDFPIEKENNKKKEFTENVYFEIGYASAVGIPIVLMKDVKKSRFMGRNLPFSIRDLPIIGFQEGLTGNGLCILLESLIEINDTYKERIKLPKKKKVPVGKWSGEYCINNSVHHVRMEKYNENDLLCTLNIIQDDIAYEVKEILRFHRRRKEGWFEFRATAYYNVIEENRLDYLLDGYLIKRDKDGSLIAKVWDNENNDGNNPRFQLLPDKYEEMRACDAKYKNMDKKYDVFVSHSSKDNKLVKEICVYLKSFNYQYFVDFESIPVGQKWPEAIIDALENSKMMIAVVSENYMDSHEIDRELVQASRNELPILPLRLSDVEMTGTKSYFLQPIQGVNIIKNGRIALDELNNQITKVLGTKTVPILKSQELNGKDIEVFSLDDAKFKMVYVEGGRFTMGATSEQGNDCYLDESPIHSVILNDFWIGETVVTQELWEKIMGFNPSYFKGAQLPVESVSWDDVNKFIERINLKTGKKFRLLTEAEWEYAARGGNKSCHFKYSGSNDAQEVGWTVANSDLRTHEVKSKLCNELGIYDMTGNVWEWVYDWKGQYSSDSQINPKGPKVGEEKECRGGSWKNHDYHCRTAQRNGNKPNTSANYIGFRLAL